MDGRVDGPLFPCYANRRTHVVAIGVLLAARDRLPGQDVGGNDRRCGAGAEGDFRGEQRWPLPVGLVELGWIRVVEVERLVMVDAWIVCLLSLADWRIEGAPSRRCFTGAGCATYSGGGRHAGASLCAASRAWLQLAG